MLRIKKALIQDSDILDNIYNEAFAANPCPDSFFSQEDDISKEELSPKIALTYPSKIVLSFFEDNTLIGGAVLDTTTDTNILDLLFIAPSYQKNHYGSQAWKYIEDNYTTGSTWQLVTPTFLVWNCYFYIKKCGFTITDITDVGPDGVGMYVFTKRVFTKRVFK